jgi:hypothetical protein
MTFPAGASIAGTQHQLECCVRRKNRVCSTVVLAMLVSSSTAFAQGVDFTFFVGRAYPVYDERLTLRAPIPSLPGVEITGDTLEISTDGGLVFGGAVGFELGVLAIEGRLDATDVAFDSSSARYDLRATQSPLTGLAGSVTFGAGRFEADRLYLLSGNVRLRTPGPVSLVVSGGVSLLPDITISGSAPLSVEIAGVPLANAFSPRLSLRAAPGQSEHRFGLNGGAGLRVGAGHVAVMAEARAFYFRKYELRFAVDDAPDLIAPLLDRLDPVRFEPVIVNAQVGLVVKF